MTGRSKGWSGRARTVALVLALAVFAVPVVGAASPQELRAATAQDLSGQTVDPIQQAGGKPLVLICSHRLPDLERIWIRQFRGQRGESEPSAGPRGGNRDPRMILQEAWAEHEVEKSPGSFEARYNLGEMLQARGALGEAVEQFRVAVSIRPVDAVANNALGGAQLARGDLNAAIRQFNTALASPPDYFDAHYNLGNALGAQGDFSGAEREFAEAVRLNSSDANAEANLGSALVELGRLSEARSHYQAARAN